jgi:hypothetical protein
MGNSSKPKSSKSTKKQTKSKQPKTTTQTSVSTKATPAPTPGKASGSPPSGQRSGVPVTLVQVPPTNDNDVHGDLTVEGGVSADRSASIAYQSLLATANNKRDLRMTIRNYVTQHFFKHVKFITRGKKLAYYDPKKHPYTYCAVVTKGCNLPAGTDSIQWWETLAKKEVRRKVTQLRSDRMAALKWAYYGKCCRCCV